MMYSRSPIYRLVHLPGIAERSLFSFVTPPLEARLATL